MWQEKMHPVKEMIQESGRDPEMGYNCQVAWVKPLLNLSQEASQMGQGEEGLDRWPVVQGPLF